MAARLTAATERATGAEGARGTVDARARFAFCSNEHDSTQAIADAFAAALLRGCGFVIVACAIDPEGAADIGIAPMAMLCAVINMTASHRVQRINRS